MSFLHLIESWNPIFPPLGRFLDVRPPHSVLNLDCRQKVSNANESSRMISSWCQGPIQFQKFVKKRLFFWGLIVRQSPVLQVRCNVACKPRSCANCIALTSSRFQRQAWIYIPRCTIKSWGQVPGWIFISTNTHWGKTRLFINTPYAKWHKILFRNLRWSKGKQTTYFPQKSKQIAVNKQLAFLSKNHAF